ncbi:hypothetical protein GCM10022267_35580 [Lentzea roselyniae]|uniref:Tc1-like transposase DDE domain-containing protein n=1 Tax=Lentzea roselyniae TaxID=531940 RepID=A0ABP7B148_9PSEU
MGCQPQQEGRRENPGRAESIRAARPDGAPIYVILDNLSAHKGEQIRRWARKNRVELCFTPTYASWADPGRGPLRATAAAQRRRLPPEVHPERWTGA